MQKSTKQKFDDLFGRDDITVLGLESSCDETAAAVTYGKRVVSSVVASQAQIHQRFGGVVPEVASRNHTVLFTSVIDTALKKAGLTLDNIDVIAVTNRPGLVGSLLVGVSTAKALSMAKQIPLVAVNHIHAHICANYAVFDDKTSLLIKDLTNKDNQSTNVDNQKIKFNQSICKKPSDLGLLNNDLKPPFLALVASGGHTSIIDVKGFNDFTLTGSTIDDAIGEAFDKVARQLGLPYPGGPNVDKHASSGNVNIEFFRKKSVKKDYSLSYSGLKTAVVNYIHNQNQKGLNVNINDVCASFSHQAVTMLVDTLFKAAQDLNRKTIVIAGGVAANSTLRNMLLQKADGKKIIMPPLHLCTDNAVMVALKGFFSASEGKDFADLDLNAFSSAY